MLRPSQMSVLALTSECGYMLKFNSELTLRCEDWYIQKGRNHHVTTLIALNSSQMSIIFIIVNHFICSEKRGYKSDARTLFVRKCKPNSVNRTGSVRMKSFYPSLLPFKHLMCDDIRSMWGNTKTLWTIFWRTLCALKYSVLLNKFQKKELKMEAIYAVAWKMAVWV